MNSEVYKLNKTSQKRSRVEQLLMVDHSDIYFENEKLGDRLNRYLHELRKEFHKNVLLRDNEIKDLNKELEVFKAILKTSEIGRKIREEAERSDTPENIPGNTEFGESNHQISLKRRLRALTPDISDFTSFEEKQHKVRIKSSLEIFPEEPLHIPIPRSRSLSPASERGSIPDIGLRSQSSVSGKRLNQKSKERVDISNFPQEWFTTVVPASDAVLSRSRRQKSAPLHQQLRMLRTRKPEVKKDSEENNSDKEDEEPQGLKVICDTPVRPVVMSLRQLKEIANIDNLAEKVPNKYEIIKKERIERAKEHFGRLESRCKIFVETIKRKTELDEEELEKSDKDSNDDT